MCHQHTGMPGWQPREGTSHHAESTAESKKGRLPIIERLSHGVGSEVDMTSLPFRLGAERLVREMLEQAVTDYVGREQYRRQL